MIKTLKKIGNSKGIILDKALLQLMKMDEDGGAFEVQFKDGGLFLKPLSTKKIYSNISKKFRKSLDKLG